MSYLHLIGILFLFIGLLFGCSSDSQSVVSNSVDEPIKENTSRDIGISGKEYLEEIIEPVPKEQESSNSNEKLIKTQPDSVSSEEMELLKDTLRIFIFDEYMGSSDYVYAKGVNWAENFYDNLTAEEIWNVIEEYKEMNNGEEGTLFEQANYLSAHAPIKDNWKELFLENWNNSSYNEEIETIIDQGDTVWIYTNSLPYTGEKDNYPYVTVDKRTGSWHG